MDVQDIQLQLLFFLLTYCSDYLDPISTSLEVGLRFDMHRNLVYGNHK